MAFTPMSSFTVTRPSLRTILVAAAALGRLCPTKALKYSCPAATTSSPPELIPAHCRRHRTAVGTSNSSVLSTLQNPFATCGLSPGGASAASSSAVEVDRSLLSPRRRTVPCGGSYPTSWAKATLKSSRTSVPPPRLARDPVPPSCRAMVGPTTHLTSQPSSRQISRTVASASGLAAGSSAKSDCHQPWPPPSLIARRGDNEGKGRRGGTGVSPVVPSRRTGTIIVWVQGVCDGKVGSEWSGEAFGVSG
mmetsp:Transcript_32294/g.80438  ORF Transcript_32294/g.80438 Transcript_32294/m.80438 type:complete len:249 (-) Transcript_32294:65-811(-)